MSLTSPEAANTPTPADGTRPHSEQRALARRILLDALFLGGLADALLHDGFGVGVLVWMIAFAATTVHHARQRPEGLRREQTAWLVAALFFAGCFAWRDSGELLFYDFIALLGALLFYGATLAPASPMRTILGQRVRDLALTFVFGMRSIIGGFIPAFRESELGAPRSWRDGRASGVLRAILLATPIMLVFGILLVSADPLFASLISLPQFDVATALSHVVLTAVIAWLTAGGLRAAFGENHRSRTPRRHERALALVMADVTAILGGVIVLFALFLSVQIGWLFGGERLVRSTTGLSYADYARHGFFELVWVTLLLLPVLLGTRALIRDGDEITVRRHRILATPLLVLVGGVMASALGRMALYVHYYGPSADRLYATVFMGWLAVVFAWFGLTILRGRLCDFAAGMTITGFLTLAGLNALNPEALVARASIARASAALQLGDSLRGTPVVQGRSTGSPIDYPYLAWRLDGDASSAVVGALTAPPVSPLNSSARMAEVRERCEAVRTMLTEWGHRGTASKKDWRRWNLGAWRAQSAVQSNEAALRAVTCADEPGEVPFGTREQRAPVRGEQWYREAHP